MPDELYELELAKSEIEPTAVSSFVLQYVKLRMFSTLLHLFSQLFLQHWQ